MFTDLNSIHDNNPADTKNGFAVVELFTSEGCSSCPSADAAVIALSRELGENVYFLGYHVDYWNYLGWKDEYSSKEFTERQRLYGDYFSLNSIYTPQVVVNGKTEFVGSDKSRLKQTIADELKISTNPAIELAAQTDSTNQIAVTYKTTVSKDEQLMIALVQLMATTNVKRGENKGYELKHINIVRELRAVKPGTSAILFSIPVNLTTTEIKIVAFIQNKNTLHISNANEALLN
jgi:hypothetical protein